MFDMTFRLTRFHRLLRRVQRPWLRYVEQRALSRYTISAHQLLDRLIKDGQIDAGDTSPRVVRAIRTHSDVAVMFISDMASGQVSKVLKLPLTSDAERSTTYHRQVVMALHQMPELEAFCRLVPKALTWGEYERQAYYLETALPGIASHELVRKRMEPTALKSQAVQTIRQLHLVTAQRQLVDEAIFVRLAGTDLANLRQLAIHWNDGPAFLQSLHALEAFLRRHLLGCELPFSWFHGDYWPGNILIQQSDGTLSGIVDWDRSSSQQLAILDILHMLAYTRKMQRRTELGEEILYYLLPAAFDAEERRLIDETVAQLGLPANAEFLQAATLLYWLHFAVANLSRYPSFQRDKYWIQNNVLLVLKRGLS
jgi:aminoglycoside phosphotransferase (APT) family kinase protein